MLREWRAAVLALSLLATAVCGCSNNDPPNGGARSAPTTSTDSSNPPRATRSSPSGSATAREITGACTQAQRKAAGDYHLSQAASSLTASSGRSSAHVRRDLARYLVRTENRLRTRCDHVPAEFTRFASDVERATTPTRSRASTVDRVLAAWLRWGAAAGASRAARHEISRLNFCRTHVYPHIEVNYRIWWAWDATGKKWWIELTMDNRTGQTLSGEMSGTAEATQWMDDPFGPAPPPPGPGRHASLSWGGSSADFLRVAPGISRVLVDPDADTDVETKADGALRVTDIAVVLGGTGRGCTIPVQQDQG